MSPRPLPVTVAAIIQALFSLMNFPGSWWYTSPGWKNHQRLLFTQVLRWALWASLLPWDYG